VIFSFCIISRYIFLSGPFCSLDCFFSSAVSVPNLDRDLLTLPPRVPYSAVIWFVVELHFAVAHRTGRLPTYTVFCMTGCARVFGHRISPVGLAPTCDGAYRIWAVPLENEN